MNPLRPLNFVGSGWSLWSPHKNARGELNVLTAERRITSEILHVLCVRPGEDPIHPEAGRAPMLFESLSNKTPQFFLHTTERTILDQVAGIASLSVDIVDPKEGSWRNAADISVVFTPEYDLSPHHLTFGFYAYEGPNYTDFRKFIRDIHLDGKPFLGL